MGGNFDNNLKNNSSKVWYARISKAKADEINELIKSAGISNRIYLMRIAILQFTRKPKADLYHKRTLRGRNNEHGFRLFSGK